MCIHYHTIHRGRCVFSITRDGVLIITEDGVYSLSHYSQGTVCIDYHTARCVFVITEDGVNSLSHGTVCIFFIEDIVYIIDHRGRCGYSSSEGTVCIFIITGDSAYT